MLFLRHCTGTDSSVRITAQEKHVAPRSLTSNETWSYSTSPEHFCPLCLKVNINGKVGGGELTQTGRHSYKGNVKSSQVTQSALTVCVGEAAGAVWLRESTDLQAWFFQQWGGLPHFLVVAVRICPEAVCSFVGAFPKER